MGHEMTGSAQSGRFGLTGEGDGGDGDVRHPAGYRVPGRRLYRRRRLGRLTNRSLDKNDVRR